MTKLKLKVKDYPVLQDIDWNISDILIHNPEGSIEEIVFKITDGVSSDTIKECRTQLFKIALCKLREEISVKENTDIAIRLRNRRGETSNAKNAKDLVELFRYVSSICAGFPHNAILPGSIIDNTPRSVQGAGAIQPKDVQPGAAPREAAQRKAVQRDRVHATNRSQNAEHDDLRAIVEEILVRCRDHDNAILDLQCTLGTAMSDIKDLRSQIEQLTIKQHALQNKTGTPNTHENVVHQSDSYPQNLNSSAVTVTSSPSPDQPAVDTYDKTNKTIHLEEATNCNKPPPNDDLDEQNSYYIEFSSSRSLIDMLCSDSPARDNSVPSQIEKSANGTTDTASPVVNEAGDRYSALKYDVDKLLVEMLFAKESIDDIEKRMNSLESASETNKQPVCSTEHVTHVPDKDNELPRASTPAQNRQRDGENPRPDPDWELYDESWPGLPNVSCSNRYAPLSDLAENNARQTSNPDTQRDHTCPVNLNRSPKRNRTRRKKRVTIVGALLVRDLGPLVHGDDLEACSYPNPGCTTRFISQRLQHLAGERDDVIVIQSAVNNIPMQPVTETIKEVGEMIDNALITRPRSKLIIAEVPARVDKPYLNIKIKKLNIFLRHKCTKHQNLHLLKHDFSVWDYQNDGLHLNQTGKLKYAQHIRQKCDEILGSSGSAYTR